MLVNRVCALLSQKYAARIVFCSEASLRTHKKLNYAAEKTGSDSQRLRPGTSEARSAARESLRAELVFLLMQLMIGYAASLPSAQGSPQFYQAAERCTN